MLKKMWTLMKRHHRQGIFTCALVGGGFLLAKYGTAKLHQRKQNNMIEYFEHFRRGKHYETTQQNCNQTVLQLTNNLRTSITNLLDSDELRSVLKTNPKNKIQLWEELKIIAFTRAAVAALANPLLVLLLRVQFNIIGGHLYLSTKNEAKTDENCMLGSSELQEKFLQCVEHFLGTGLGRLVDLVKGIVEEVVGGIPLKEKLKLANVDEILKAIKARVVPLSDLSAILLPAESVRFVPDSIRGDLIKLLNETSDILESEEFLGVLCRAVEMCFANLSDLVTDFYVQIDGAEGREFRNPHEIDAAMAKLIPAVNNFVFVQCSTKPKHVLENLLQDETIKLFGANVYDAFSQPTQVVFD